LNKAIYDLKQAQRVWNAHINGFLTKSKFRRCESDHNVYVLKENKWVIIFLALYVHDLLIISKELWAMKKMKDLLSQKFEMKDLGEMEYCLGIEVRKDRMLKTIRLG
jgi:hypothetical protein